MSLTLYIHPLSSFAQKAIIAFYETGTPFNTRMLDHTDAAVMSEFKALWPIAKMPVLRDEARGKTIPESSIIIEYIGLHYPGKASLLPSDPQALLMTRYYDRFFDLHINVPMQKVITDRLRPEGKNDPHGVAEARTLLRTALGLLDKELGGKTWAVGDTFTMADCAAAPSLFYTDMGVMPLRDDYPNVAAYLDRLKQRPSYARVLKEAEPFFKLVPKEK